MEGVVGGFGWLIWRSWGGRGVAAGGEGAMMRGKKGGGGCEREGVTVVGCVGKTASSLYWLARERGGSRLLTVSNEILLTEC